MRKLIIAYLVVAFCLVSGTALSANGDPVLAGSAPAIVGTNITGTASGLTAGNVTTNANLSGDVTSIGNATTIKEAPAIKAVTVNTGTELVTNGSDWTDATGTTPPTGWTKAGSNNSTFDIDSGRLKITYVDGVADIYQTVATVVGHIYKVSASVENQDLAINLLFRVGSSGNNSAEYADIQGQTETDPTTHTAIFTATGTATTITFYIQGNSNGQYGWIGSVTLKELPLTINGDAYLTGNARIVIPTYPNNAAAIAGGLVAGQFYRVNATTDPEPIYIVH